MDYQLIDTLLDLATKAGFTQAEAYYTQGESFNVSVLDGEIEDYRVESQQGLSLRGLIDGKMGYASTEAVDEEDLDELVAAAKENAALIQSPDQTPLHDGKDEIEQVKKENKIARLSAKEKIELALEMERLAKAADPRVLRMEGCELGTQVSRRIIQNTLGLRRESSGALGFAAAMPIIKNGEDMLSGMYFEAFDDFNKLDIKRVAEKAVEDGVAYIGASSMPSGSVPVVLRNDVMATLLRVFSGVFSAEAADKGLSLLKGREGESIAAACVTLWDDPFCEQAYSGSSFDGEGVATHKKAVVENGSFRTLLYNLKYAKKAGIASTGNASRPSYASTVGIAPSNFYLAPGQCSREALFERAKNGVMITDLMGMHAGANPVSGDFSLAAKGFLIQEGKIVRPVEQITVAGNFYALLQGVQAVADDLWFTLPGASSFGSASVLVEGLSIAGK